MSQNSPFFCQSPLAFDFLHPLVDFQMKYLYNGVITHDTLIVISLLNQPESYLSNYVSFLVT